MQFMTESKLNVIFMNKPHTETTEPKDRGHRGAPAFDVTVSSTEPSLRGNVHGGSHLSPGWSTLPVAVAFAPGFPSHNTRRLEGELGTLRVALGWQHVRHRTCQKCQFPGGAAPGLLSQKLGASALL